MDDQHLDDSIKRKLSDYTPEGYDPSAFAALRYRLESSQLSFYSRYRTEILTSSAAALISIILVLTQWIARNDNERMLDQKLKSQEVVIFTLQRQIEDLKASIPDKIHVDSQRESGKYTELLRRISTLEYALKQTLLNDENTVNSSNVSALDAIQATAKDSYVVEDDYTYSPNGTTTLRINPSPKKGESLRAEPEPSTSLGPPSKPDLSAKTIRDIERHYHPGVGIKVGPVAEVLKGTFKHGTGNLNISTGILADFILSPSLSLESGAKYVHRDYAYQNSDLVKLNLPSTDASLGELKKAEIDSWMIEIPATLKYRHPISMKADWIFGLGYSQYLMLRQSFDYSYEYNSGDGIFINKTYNAKKTQVYPGTINVSLGFRHQLKHQKIETSLSFNKGVSSFGMERSRANYFGLRTVLWFDLK